MNTNRSIYYLSLFLIIVSVVALLLAPLLMPSSYDWIRHTTSESGAQGIAGAWLARLGFVLYGMAVLLLVSVKKAWGAASRFIHSLFGLGMIGNAIFSSQTWLSELPFDAMEDTLHSWMSGLVGTAFTVGVLVVFFQRNRSDGLAKLFDMVAVLVSVVVTLIMFSDVEGIAGFVQRVMFAVSYLWYTKEVVTTKV